MIVAAHQPNYLPWLGFFDKMSKCDVFILEDVVQFTYHEFQNRNRIKTKNGIKWLTVPVEGGRKRKRYSEIFIANEYDWSKRHWLTLKQSYGKAPFWNEFCNFFEETYHKQWNRLLDLNVHLIKGIMEFFNIDKELVLASSLKSSGIKNDLIISQCKTLGAKTYLSGLGARTYLDLDRFEGEGIEVIFQGFVHPVYPQVGRGFVPNLSVVDYLFCAGGRVGE